MSLAPPKSVASATPHAIVLPQNDSGQLSSTKDANGCCAGQHQPESIWQATFHDPIAFYTACLVLVTGLLWFFTARLWRATVDLGKDAKEAAASQGERMERSIELANEEFVAAHGPIVRAMQFNIDVEGWAATGRPQHAEIFIYNDGRNDASFVGERAFGSARFWIGEHPPAGRPFGPEGDSFEMANRLVITKLLAGDGAYWTLTEFGMVPQQDVQLTLMPKTPEKLFIIGRLHYYDTRGAQMHTIFCREFDKTKRRFVLSDYPEYENREN